MENLSKYPPDVIDATGGEESGRILFKENSSFIICGRTGSGKTTFIAEMLENASEMFTNDDEREIFILYCYSSDQPLFEKMRKNVKNIEFFKGIPSEEELDRYSTHPNRHLILIIDDLMREAVSSRVIFEFFTVKAHHQQTSIMYVSHNLYEQGKYSRANNLNAAYYILFANPRGADQISTLSRQVFPGQKGVVVQAFKLATTSKKFGYLVLDMTTNIPDELRMRSCVLPHEVTKFYDFGRNE